MATHRQGEPYIPSPQAAATAQKAAQALGAVIAAHPEQVTVSIGATSVPDVRITISSEIIPVIAQMLQAIGEGKPVAMVPLDTEISTQSAADLLNVSRPYLVKLLEEGAIPSRRVGVYRRGQADVVLEYKRKTDALRYEVLAELTKEARRARHGILRSACSRCLAGCLRPLPSSYPLRSTNVLCKFL